MFILARLLEPVVGCYAGGSQGDSGKGGGEVRDARASGARVCRCCPAARHISYLAVSCVICGGHDGFGA